MWNHERRSNSSEFWINLIREKQGSRETLFPGLARSRNGIGCCDLMTWHLTGGVVALPTSITVWSRRIENQSRDQKRRVACHHMLDIFCWSDGMQTDRNRDIYCWTGSGVTDSQEEIDKTGDWRKENAINRSPIQIKFFSVKSMFRSFGREKKSIGNVHVSRSFIDRNIPLQLMVRFFMPQYFISPCNSVALLSKWNHPTCDSVSSFWTLKNEVFFWVSFPRCLSTAWREFAKKCCFPNKIVNRVYLKFFWQKVDNFRVSDDKIG